MVATANAAPNLAVRHLCVFMAEIHRELAGFDDGLLAALAHHLALLGTEMLANGRNDVVNGEFFSLHVDNAGHDASSQMEVYIAVVVDGIGHNAVDNAFQLSHTALGILCDILHHFIRECQAVAANLRLEDGLAQLRVGLFHLGHHAPFESRQHAVFNAFEEHWRTVAGDDELAAVLLQMVEDVEKGLLRFRRRNFLNIVDDQYVYRLVEVDEIIGGVVDDGVSELRLKHMGRYEEHTFVGESLLDGKAHGIHQVGLPNARRSIEEEGIEGGLSGMFRDGNGHGMCQLIALAFDKTVETVAGIEVGAQRRQLVLLVLLGLLLLFILAFLLLRLRPFCHLLFVAKEDLRELSEGDIDGFLQEGAVVLTDIVAYILVGHTDGELVAL